MNKQAKIILFSCMYIWGIISYFFQHLWIINFIIFIGLFYFGIKKNYFSIKYLISILTIFLFGMFNSYFHLKYQDDLTSFADETIEVTAKVISIPSNNIKDRTKFYAKVSQVKTEQESTQQISAKTLVTINDTSERISNIKIGDTLTLNGKLKVPNIAQNPSQFDYARYLQFKNTFSLIYVNDNWAINNSASDILGKSLRKLNDIRNDIIKIHAQNIQSPMLEILGGIIFGDDAVNPDEETKESFINSGIFHILAASGMNVTLILGIWLFFTTRLKFNYKFSLISGIALIIFYTCMTGFGPPILRATLMLILILIAKLIDRKTSTMAILFLVAFLILCFNPLMIFDIGFQLSFIVTFALILTSPLLQIESKIKFLNYVLGACLIPVIAQIFALPLQMYYFNTFSSYSVFANIAIIPVLSIVSFIGFISSIIAIIPMFAQKICFIADFILNPLLIYIVKVANFFSELPNAIIYLKKPTTIQVCLYFSIVILITCIFRYKLFFRKIYITLSILILALFTTFIPLQSNNTEILFFSVGNADSILIKSPNNKYFLIDNGKLPYKTENSQANFIILKYLTDIGIKDLKGLILSHFDADHAGGTLDIFKKLNVEKVYMPYSNKNTLLFKNIINYIKENKIPNEIIGFREHPIYKEKDFTISLIRTKGDKIKYENEESVITLLTDKNNKVLFMGDGNINTYNALPKEFKENISIMKLGHHGASYTINDNMAKNTDLFIISTGFNVYNHPHPMTLEILNKNNKPYLRTDYNNAIKIILRKKQAETFIFSPKLHKFIRHNVNKC